MSDVTEADLERVRRSRKIINPDGNEARELAKFEQFPSAITSTYGVGNPYRYREYPRMLYKAFRDENGQIKSIKGEPHPAEFQRSLDPSNALRLAQEAVVVWNSQCTKVVGNDAEYQAARESGWCPSPTDAVAWCQAREHSQAQAVAERNYQDRNMSDKAKAEAARADAATMEYVAEVKEQPRQRTAR